MRFGKCVFRLLATLAGCLTMLVIPASGAAYDLAADFSFTNNPGGVWTYGCITNLGGTLVPYTLKTQPTDNYSNPYQQWALASGGQPCFLKNPNAVTNIGASGLAVLAPGMVAMFPGSGINHYCTVRFTAPTAPENAGLYAIESAVRSYYDGNMSGDSDYRVFQNGNELFGRNVNTNSSTTYTNVVALNPGDTLDFLCGRGNEPTFNGAGLKIQLQINKTTNFSLPPAILSSTSNFVVYEGTTFKLTSQVAGTPPLSFQWWKDGVKVADATNAILSVTNSASSDAGSYQLVVTNTYGSATGAIWNITTAVLPIFCTDSLDGGIVSNQWSLISGNPKVTNYAGAVSGSNSLWFGSSGTRYITSRPLDARAGGVISFYLRMGNDTANWNKPEIPGEGIAVDYSLDSGVTWISIATFTNYLSAWTLCKLGIPKAAEVAPVQFRWKQLGSPSTGIDNWAIDDVNISCGPALPIINSVSEGQFIFSGSNAIFQVQAGGTEPLLYQWYFGNSPILEATNNSLSLNGVQTNQAGNYYVVVSNTLGYTTSAPVALNVYEPPPRFNGYDLSQDFSTTANPTGPWTYGTMTNVGSPLLVFSYYSQPKDNNGRPYQAWMYISNNQPEILRNGSCYTNIGASGLAVLMPLEVALFPGSGIYQYAVARFTIPTNGGGDYLVETLMKEYYDGSLAGDSDFRMLTNGVQAFGAYVPKVGTLGYTNVLRLSPGSTVDFLCGRGSDGVYYGGVKIQARLSCVTNLLFAPQILSVSSNQAVWAGSNITLQVQVSGTDPLAYQWSLGGNPIADATNHILALNAVQTNQAGTYQVVVSNVAGSVTSTPIVLNVEVPPTPFNGYDLAADFSSSVNPAGAWTYGTMTNVGSQLLIFGVQTPVIDNYGHPYQAWMYVPNDQPCILRNGSSITNVGAGGLAILPPGMVAVFPGAGLYRYAVVRFTVPSNGGGDYLVETLMKEYYDGSLAGDSDFRLLTNGVQAFSGYVPKVGTLGYTNLLRLSPGSTVDFLCGRGSDGVYYGGVKIQARLSCVTNFVFAPQILNVSSNQTVWAGSNVTLQVQAGGTDPLAYQWSLGGYPIADATNRVLTLNTVQTNQAGIYQVVVNNAVGSVTSTPMVLNVEVPLPPFNGFDLAADFSSIVNPAGAWTYGTMTNVGSQLLVFSTQTPVTDNYGRPYQAWMYIPNDQPCILRNGSAVTNVGAGGLAILPPGMVAVFPGAGLYRYAVVRFTVPFNGGGDYLVESAMREYYDGSLAGDSDFRLLTNGVQAFSGYVPKVGTLGYTNVLRLSPGSTVDFLCGRGSDGVYYGGVKIQARLSCVTNLLFAPQILSVSSNQTVWAGSNVTLQVQANGTDPLTYQWSSGGNPIADATNRLITLNVVQTNQAGTYQVVVSNALGSVTSSPVVLNVEVPPAPFNGYDLATDYSTTANPSGPWTFGTMTNAASPLLVFGNYGQPADGIGLRYQQWMYVPGDQPCILRNGNSINMVGAGGLAVLAPGMVAAFPGSGIYQYCVVRFTVPSSGGGDYLVETLMKEYYDGSLAGDSDFRVLTNGVQAFGAYVPKVGTLGYTNVLRLSPGSTVDFLCGRGSDGVYYGGVKIQARLSCVTNLMFAPQILSVSSNQTVWAGSNVTLQVQASGTDPLAYQWSFGGNLIMDATNRVLTLNTVQTNQAGTYQVVVSNAIGNVTSSPVVLSVEVPPPPFNGYDLAADFSSAVNPAGAWTYGTMTNVGSQLLVFGAQTPVTDNYGHPYQAWMYIPNDQPCILRNGSAVTNVGAWGLAVLPPGMVAVFPGAGLYRYAVVRFTVPFNGGGDYLVESAMREYYDGSLAGDSDFRLLTNGVQAFSGYVPKVGTLGYTNVLRLSPGSTVDFLCGRGSDGVYYGGVKIQARFTYVTNLVYAPQILSTSSNQTVWTGSNVTLEVQANGTDPLAYQWSFGSNTIADATNRILTLNAVQIDQAGTYFAVVSNSLGMATSAPMALTVRIPNQEPPEITQQPVGASVAVGGSATLNATVTGAAPLNFQWSFNGLLLSGATNQTLILTNLQLASAGTYTVMVTNMYGRVTSVGALLNVDNYSGGAFIFANFFGTNRAWIYDVDSTTKLEGAQYLAQLYAGTDALNLQPIGAAVPFKTGYFAGLFSGGSRYINAISPGDLATVQVKAWDCSFGSSYEMAAAVGGKVGASRIFTAKSGGFMMPPMPLAGLNSFSLQLSFTPPPPPAMSQTLQDRAIPTAEISSLVAYTNGVMMINARGEQGMTYQLQVSEDLKTWTVYTNMVNYEGIVRVLDAVKKDGGKFYRIQIME